MTLAELETTIKTLRNLGLSDSDPTLQKAIAERDALLAQANNTATPIYDTLVANAKFPLTQEKKDCITETVDAFLDPNLSKDAAKEPGLLLGNIQCGKTDTFENIIGLAFDKGFDIAVVFTKNNTALTKQTKMRAEKDFAAFAAGKGHRATVYIHDIMEIRTLGLNQATVDNSKTIIICKKQKDNLDALIKLFNNKNKFLKYKKVLIVDDEADFASRNYKKSGKRGNTNLEAFKTTEQIDDFRCILDFSRYLQVTATPYSLLLQPEGQLNLTNGTLEPFKPRFISIVPTHDKYIGAKQYFEESKDLDSMYSYLYNCVSPNGMQVLYKSYKPYLTEKGHESQNLFGLECAICNYLMSTAIRRIQERKKNPRADYHSSAVFHIEIGKDKHDWQCELISSVVEDMKAQFKNQKFSSWLTICMAVADKYLKDSINAGKKKGLITVDYPTTDAIYKEIEQMFAQDNINITKVNSDNVIVHLLDQNTGELQLNAAANIFVGGNVLDRGITIQHMLCFFYGRNPSTFQQDTVLQHARMFGARSLEDMAVTRFHTTARIYRAFEMMCEMDADLRRRIIESKKNGTDIGTVFVGFNTQIKPCAPSKTAASDINHIQANQRVLPIGFMSGYKTHIKSIVDQIDNLITMSPHYLRQDKDGFFEISKETVVKILKLTKETYLYSAYYENEAFEKDITHLLCTLEYALSVAKDKNKLYCWHLTGRNMTGRNMNRIRPGNGGFEDSPEGGKVFIDKARNKAVDCPVIILIKQNGKRCVDSRGKNLGWNDAEFYWPVLITQKNIKSAVYSIDNK